MARLTTADAAYCAAAWASGEKQKDLAATFGLKTPTICVAIRAFLNTYADVPPHRRHVWVDRTGDGLRDNLIYGDERKALVPGALRAFQRSRG